MIYECTIQDGTHFCRGEGGEGGDERKDKLRISMLVTILLGLSGWAMRMGFMIFFLYFAYA